MPAGGLLQGGRCAGSASSNSPRRWRSGEAISPLLIVKPFSLAIGGSGGRVCCGAGISAGLVTSRGRNAGGRGGGAWPAGDRRSHTTDSSPDLKEQVSCIQDTDYQKITLLAYKTAITRKCAVFLTSLELRPQTAKSGSSRTPICAKPSSPVPERQFYWRERRHLIGSNRVPRQSQSYGCGQLSVAVGRPLDLS